MHRRKRPLWLIITSLLSISGLIYMVIKLPPSLQFPVSNYQIPVLIPGFFLLFIFLFSLSAFIFASTRRGVLIGLFFVIYLILRLNNLTHPFFLILLLILFGSIELLFAKRK